MHKLAQFIYDDVADVADALDFSELNGKTVLITGATGLIGTYLTASLKAASDMHAVKPLLLAIGHGEADAYYRDLLPNDARLLHGDLTDDRFLRELPHADYIIHAAGYGQPGRFLSDPVRTLKINTGATSALLERLKPEGKFLFMSTSEVYSGSKNIPHCEDDIGTTNTMHKRACYIEGKRSGEAISAAFRANGISVKAARASLIYGPGTRKGDQRVLNEFIAKGLQGEIALMNEGRAKRTYCYVTDAADMLWRVLLSGKDFVYNVAGESKISIAGLAAAIGDHLKVPFIIPAASHALTEAPEDVWLDLTKIKNEFGKTRFVSLDQGLKKTIDWQKMLYEDL